MAKENQADDGRQNACPVCYELLTEPRTHVLYPCCPLLHQSHITCACEWLEHKIGNKLIQNNNLNEIQFPWRGCIFIRIACPICQFENIAVTCTTIQHITATTPKENGIHVVVHSFDWDNDCVNSSFACFVNSSSPREPLLLCNQSVHKELMYKRLVTNKEEHDTKRHSVFKHDQFNEHPGTYLRLIGPASTEIIIQEEMLPMTSPQQGCFFTRAQLVCIMCTVMCILIVFVVILVMMNLS